MMMPESLRDAPPGRLSVGAEEVQVWSFHLDRVEFEVARLVSCLAADEQARAVRYCFERDRRRFAVGRAILRGILSRYLGLESCELVFSYGVHGKPTLAPGCGDGALRFNVSHSHGIALVAVARWREIGVDVECVRRLSDREGIVERCFSPEERALIGALPDTRRAEAFFNGWTRKEAYLKALGDGLARPLESVDVSLAPGEPAKLVRVGGDPREASRWTLWGFSPMPGTVAAVAIEGHAVEMTCRPWPFEG